MNCQ
jgi:regulator of replication initiation timing